MLNNFGCANRHINKKVEFVTDTVNITIPERSETLTVYTGVTGIKDTIIVQKDTIEKVAVRFIKVKDTIHIDCICDTMTISKIDTITYITTKETIVEKKRRLSKFERIAIIGFIVMLLLMIIKFIK